MKRNILTGGILLGAGLGGFLDGIVLHQILQTHSMLSARLPQDLLVNVKVSMIWDGIFHLFSWMLTVAGLIATLRNRSVGNHLNTGSFFGANLAGWGVFNLIEGTLDHLVFDLHHVVERYGRSAYDYGFLAFGALLVVIGWAIIKTSEKKIMII